VFRDIMRKIGLTTTCLVLCAMAGVAGAAEGSGGHSRSMLPFVFSVINFLLFLLVLYKYALPRIKGFFTERSQKIRQSLYEAEEVRVAAEAKLRECEKKLEVLDKQVEDIRMLMKKEGAAEKERIVREAEREAETIKNQARTVAEQEIRRAKQELRAELIKLSLERAEGTLTSGINKDDQLRLIHEYIKEVTPQRC
jgi:F-type H+-transporting ATPase subunit b